SGWNGVGAPKNTPVEIIDKLNKEINAALADPAIKARLADLGGTPLSGSPAEFGELVIEETEKWAKVVRFSGAKPEEVGGNNEPFPSKFSASGCKRGGTGAALGHRVGAKLSVAAGENHRRSSGG